MPDIANVEYRLETVLVAEMTLRRKWRTTLHVDRLPLVIAEGVTPEAAEQLAIQTYERHWVPAMGRPTPRPKSH